MKRLDVYWAPPRAGHPARASSWSQFWSHSPPFTTVHRRPRPPARAGHGRWRTVVNAGAQYSKACEGASLPWVQIPPPPPLTCENTGSWQPPGGYRGTPLAHLCGSVMSRVRPAAGISRGCCAWSRTSWTGVTGVAHAAEACALPFSAGRDRPRPGCRWQLRAAGYPPTHRPHHTE